MVRVPMIGVATRTGRLLGVALASLVVFYGLPDAEEQRCAKAQRVAGTEKSLPALHGGSFGRTDPDCCAGLVFDGRHTGYAEIGDLRLCSRADPGARNDDAGGDRQQGQGWRTISMMVARFERDVISFRPDLLVWQLGVNDVLAMDDVSAPISDMRQALKRFTGLNLPVVLVDLQVAPAVDRDRDTRHAECNLGSCAPKKVSCISIVMTS